MKAIQNKGMQVVLDTNVYISALVFSEGPLFGVWKLVCNGRYTVVISPAILHEFITILREKFGYPEERREKVKRTVARVAEIVQPKTVPNVIVDDPDDNHILAAAIEGHVDLIVSGDRHLLSLKEYRGIPIVRPMDFLRTLGEK